MRTPSEEPHNAPHLTRRGIGLLASAALGTAALGKTVSAEREFTAAPTAPQRKPNILVIIGDDLGWKDLGCYGSSHIRTPNLDRLAAQGTRFTQGYSSAAVCSPTRIALYTGRYPGRLPGGLVEPITKPNPRHGLPPEHPTLASLLGSNGYTTALFGKWHCGYLPWFSPTKSGWHEFFGNFSGALDYHSKVSHNAVHDLYEGEEPVRKPGYYTDLVTDRTVEFLRRKHDRPWLLNLNFTSAHWPWERRGDTEVSKELTARVRAGEHKALSHQDGGSVAIYREMVETLDQSVGRVLDTLRATGQERDTIVLFFSDNGGERFSESWPLSSGKGALYEGGIRVPTTLRWPAKVSGGQVSHTPVVSHDWTATLLEAAGAAIPNGYSLDGTSLAGHLFRGERAPQRDLFWRTRVARALRRGKWKYLRTPGDGSGPRESLFDLSTDIGEQANLADKRPQLLNSLRQSWEEINADLLTYH